jgi:GNAT superfamily N-acetyltransferase
MDIQAETVRWSDGLANLPVERCVLVAVEKEKNIPVVIGFCACGTEREMDPEYSAEIYALYVLPGRQGKGTGRALLQVARDWLRNQGHKRMVIYTLRDNHPARRFYEAVGGTLVRERMWDIHGEKMPEVGYGFDL